MKKLTALISAFFFFIVGASQGWALPNCVEPRSINLQNCFGTFTWSDGENYVGEFGNGEFHGQGTYTFGPNSEWAGDKYVGEFKDNNFHGQGTYTFADGTKEVGDFKYDKLNGYAIQYYPDGSIYQEGIFKDNVLVEEE